MPMKSQAQPKFIEVLVAQDLDAFECPNPNCADEHPFFIHPQCHPNSGLDLSYAGDILNINCHVCKQLAARIRVARAEVQ